MTDIEKLADLISKLDVNNPMHLIQIVCLQGAIAGQIKAKKEAEATDEPPIQS